MHSEMGLVTIALCCSWQLRCVVVIRSWRRLDYFQAPHCMGTTTVIDFYVCCQRKAIFPVGRTGFYYYATRYVVEYLLMKKFHENASQDSVCNYRQWIQGHYRE